MEMDEDNVSDEHSQSTSNVKRKVYLPGQPLDEDERLVYDPSAYVMLHHARTDSPCLSFDIIEDDLGVNRTTFPLTAYTVAGTQSSKPKMNSIIVMKLSNLHETYKEKESDSEEDSDSDEEEEEDEKKVPVMNSVQIRHLGCVNRIRSFRHNNRVLCAAWSETGVVTILDLKSQLEMLENTMQLALRKQKVFKEPMDALFVFKGHQTEGFALDWCSTTPGVLATGDCRRNIHIWKPSNASWNVDQRPLVGHSESVEDLQWSPNDANVLASCSVDKKICIWDTRESPTSACKLSVVAHTSDVNVISWNKYEPLILSGGDDGFLHIWDLRQFKAGNTVATLKHHTEAVSTVEWHPTESSVFASGGEDNQITLWDLAVEQDSEETDEEVKDLPPQLLFIHQGQRDIKEVHWHPQIPGLLISTANTGFNVFKTISV